MPIFFNDKQNENIDFNIFSLLSSGQGLFETILFEDNILWFYERHEQRLFDGLSKFGISAPDFNIKQIILDKISLLGVHQSWRIKLICIFPFDKPPKSIKKDNFVYQIDAVKEIPISNTPLKLMSYPFPLNKETPLLGLKTIAYTHLIFARNQALANNFDDVLFINAQKLITETSYSNVFAVKNNQIFTPHLSAGLLAGTVRSILVEQLEIKEIDIKLEDIGTYDFLFVTSSVRQLRIIGQIDNFNYKKNSHLFEGINNKWELIKMDYKSAKIT